MKTSVPFGASPIDAREGTSATAPVSKARMFCRQAFAECDLDNLDDEMADLTKDLESLRNSVAQSKGYLLKFH